MTYSRESQLRLADRDAAKYFLMDICGATRTTSLRNGFVPQILHFVFFHFGLFQRKNKDWHSPGGSSESSMI